jgi:hypothetical protein
MALINYQFTIDPTFALNLEPDGIPLCLMNFRPSVITIGV